MFISKSLVQGNLVLSHNQSSSIQRPVPTEAVTQSFAEHDGKMSLHTTYRYFFKLRSTSTIHVTIIVSTCTSDLYLSVRHTLMMRLMSDLEAQSISPLYNTFSNHNARYGDSIRDISNRTRLLTILFHLSTPPTNTSYSSIFVIISITINDVLLILSLDRAHILRRLGATSSSSSTARKKRRDPRPP
ncbi:hypothetical protein F4859DRAFT_96650 [Xylaria cf. heliscus]|nr:hypothetical protein F4859DRAFT_96650 [Xylaria cf. heliscus]